MQNAECSFRYQIKYVKSSGNSIPILFFFQSKPESNEQKPNTNVMLEFVQVYCFPCDCNRMRMPFLVSYDLKPVCKTLLSSEQSKIRHYNRQPDLKLFKTLLLLKQNCSNSKQTVSHSSTNQSTLSNKFLNAPG